jgi:dihydrolipoamide dehydrogenase
VLPGLEPDGKLVWTYFEAMVPKAMPKSLLVIGSGAIGIEFASFYNAMGVDVTVVEIMDQIMPVEDTEISKVAQKQLEKQGLKFKLSAKVAKLDRKADSVTATIEAGGKSELITVDRVIAAAGVVANIENLGLEALGVKTDKGCIVSDGHGRTKSGRTHARGIS